MKIRSARILISVLVLITSCKSETEQYKVPMATEPSQLSEYRVGLGYGFLGKVVQVTIDSYDVISVVGTEEIEQYAQLQGTTMLVSGSSPKKDITVQVIVDGDQPYKQTIDLSMGKFVHIYQERTGLRVFNTHFLVQE